mmetsp:Transcript_33561/g.105685  ORF Transcript_33561/g.105685 Transcript_33561/m.105685 type:complete len:205 (-) Transcript_33561:8-622(-)
MTENVGVLHSQQLLQKQLNSLIVEMLHQCIRIGLQLLNDPWEVRLSEEWCQLWAPSNDLHQIRAAEEVSNPLDPAALFSSHRRLHLADPVGQHRQPRLMRQAILVRLEGSFEVAHAVHGSSLATITLAPIGLDSDTFLRIIQSLIIFMKTRVRRRSVGEKNVVVWIQVDRLSEEIYSFRVVLCRESCVSLGLELFSAHPDLPNA